jgi:hypothetical protein
MYDDPVSRALSVIRQHYDDGGDVEPLMSRIMERVGDKAIRDSRVLEPEAVLKPGPEQSVWDKISSRLMGDRPSPERRRFVEGMGDIADVAHMGAYATPLAPAMGAVDFARGVASGDPTEAVLGATGLPGKAAKAAGVAASAMMPEEAEAGPLQRALGAIRAYHGSPHKFDKFDISKIGTGEGAQAYGHGLYFAEAEPVARNYLGHPEARYRRFSGHMEPREEFAFDIATGMSDPRDFDIMTKLASKYGENISFDEAQDLAKRALSNRGSMYEVDIHADPDRMINWDARLGEQNKAVQDFFGFKKQEMPEFNVSETGHSDPRWKYSVDGYPAAPTEEKALKSAMDTFNSSLSSRGNFGHQAFKEAQSKYGAQGISDALKEAGIPGIKYLDGASRAGGEGSSNYVVFDPKLIEILRRYKNGGYVE